MNALLVDVDAFAFQQHVYAFVAVPHPRTCEFNDPVTQHLLGQPPQGVAVSLSR